MDNDALKNEFLVESFENLSTISEDLTTFEKTPTDKELLNKIYRTVHTMKGSASFLGYKKLQELTHNAENLLDALRDDLFEINPILTDILLQSFDMCHQMLKSIEDSNTEGDSDISLLSGKLEEALSLKGKLDEASDEDGKEIDDLDDELAGLIDEFRDEETGQSQEVKVSPKDEKPSEQAPVVNSAALDSLKELAGEGKLDQSVIDDLDQQDTSHSLNKTETSSQGDISSAAMESLKELAQDGKVDLNILDEFNDPAAVITSSENNAPKEEKQESSAQTQAQAAAARPAVLKSPEEKKLSTEETANPTPAASVQNKSIADSIVRVNVKVLDKIMNLVGELVLNRNQIVQFSSIHNDPMLAKLSQQLNTITSDLQQEVMSTRMQPVGSILTKFERLVRDFSRTSNKKIELKLSGTDTELDKTLIEAIKDPLVHIVRNASDHGLETVEERKAAGKDEVGILSIRAYNESGQVTIEISDDGRGLKRDKIASKAIEKGLATSEQIEKMTDQQVFSLIFRPGFSTAEQITNISGRGVGMDVVKTNIEKIGGSVIVSSGPGPGTTFKLRIPLTLAIVPALMVESQNEFFAIPQLNLVELVRLETKEDKSKLETIQDYEFLRLREKLTPVFKLTKELKLEQVKQRADLLRIPLEDGIGTDPTSYAKKKPLSHMQDLDEAFNIVILNAEGYYFGLIVDEILDTEEIVVKPLSGHMKDLNIFGGATIMGDGRVALILDAFGMLDHFIDISERPRPDQRVDSEEIFQADANSLANLQENLLFRLADNRTYAVPLGLVSRLEEFDPKLIEYSGEQPIIKYLDHPMPLINVEKSIGINTPSPLENLSEEAQPLHCIVATIRSVTYGIIVSEIMDIAVNNSEIEDVAVDREGVMGTIFVNDKVVSIIDIYSLVEMQNIGAVKRVELVQNELIGDGKRVLLVDDSSLYRKLEGDFLKSLGFEVVVSENGEDAFNTFTEQNFDLIVTDIEMPVMDGHEFAKKVRESEKAPSIPIIAVSTRASEDEREKGKISGFDFHLEKFRKDELDNTINKIISQRS